jgi:drug/metabolite transporter (DMT)-like permease
MSSRSSLAIAPAIAITVLFWGSAFAAIRAGLQSFSPTHLALLRFLSASLALVIFAAVTRMRLPALKDLPAVFLLGLLGFAFYNIALNIGEQSVQAGPAALLIQTAPIWTALLASIFLAERLNVMGWGGIGLGFAGALLIAFGKGESLGRGMGSAPLWSAALIVAAALSASAYSIIQKRMLSRYRPVEITTYAIWAATLLLLPFSPGLPAALSSAPAASTIAVVYLGVGPAALAYATWAVVLSRLPAGRAASFLYAVPIIAFLIGWLWLGEVPTLRDLVGGSIALGGVAVVNTVGRGAVQREGGTAGGR